MADLPAGVALAACAAACFEGAYVLQAVEARKAPSGALGELVRRPRWLAGVALAVAGAALQIGALRLAPITVVQPTLALGVVALVLVGSRVFGERLTPADLGAAAAIAGGVALLAIAGDDVTHDRIRAVPAALTLAVLAAPLLTVLALRAWPAAAPARAAPPPAAVPARAAPAPPAVPAHTAPAPPAVRAHTAPAPPAVPADTAPPPPAVPARAASAPPAVSAHTAPAPPVVPARAAPAPPSALARGDRAPAGLLVLAAGAGDAIAALCAARFAAELSPLSAVLIVWFVVGSAALIASLSAEMSAVRTWPVTRVGPLVLGGQTALPVLLAPLVVGQDWTDKAPLVLLGLVLTLAGAARLAASAGEMRAAVDGPSASGQERGEPVREDVGGRRQREP